MLLGVSLLTFLFMELAPGDPFDDLPLRGGMTEEEIQALRVRYGLDRPPATRYLIWLGAVARGDLGFSFYHERPVTALLLPRARNTLALTVSGTLLAWLVALAAGIAAAARRRGPLAAGFDGATSLLLSLPDLVVALALLLVALRTGWLPTGGMTSRDFARLDLWGQAADLLRHLALPVTALVLTTAPYLARHVRASVAEVLGSPFITAARARGIPRRRLLLRSALPAAANPLISLLGLSIASLLSASILLEVIMDWPGMGPMLLQAIDERDAHVVLGAVMLSSVLLVVGNLIADLLLAAVDPRTREG